MFPSIIHTYSILHLQDVDSTNNYAATNENQPFMQHKTVIMASFQTKGRGQHYNKWESKEGENLLLSIYIKPEILYVENQFVISRLAALSIRDCIAYFLKKPTSIKWPNDIYVNDKKIAGILIENSVSQNKIDRSIIGIGININQTEFEESGATSLKLESKKDWDLLRILEYLLYRFNHYLESLGSTNEEMHQLFDMHLYTRKEWLSMSSKKQGDFIGRILSTQKNGMLVIEDKNQKLISYNHKEILFNSK